MKFIDIQNELIKKHHINICDGTKCENDWSRTHAHRKIRRVCKWKQSNSLESTFTLSHEIGHIVNNKSTMRRCEEEYYATVWAIDELRLYGIEVPEKLIISYASYIKRELDRGIKRNGFNYDEEELNLIKYWRKVKMEDNRFQELIEEYNKLNIEQKALEKKASALSEEIKAEFKRRDTTVFVTPTNIEGKIVEQTTITFDKDALVRWLKENNRAHLVKEVPIEDAVKQELKSKIISESALEGIKSERRVTKLYVAEAKVI